MKAQEEGSAYEKDKIKQAKEIMADFRRKMAEIRRKKAEILDDLSRKSDGRKIARVRDHIKGIQ